MPLVNPLLSPSDPSNIYSPYPDPTGTPSPRNGKGRAIGAREITQADYDALSDDEKSQGVLFVIIAEGE